MLVTGSVTGDCPCFVDERAVSAIIPLVECLDPLNLFSTHSFTEDRSAWSKVVIAIAGSSIMVLDHCHEVEHRPLPLCGGRCEFSFFSFDYGVRV